ncbi:MAG: 3-mercaptopyruvate sulfurtransferase, partial [Pseudomonadota bacterium]
LLDGLMSDFGPLIDAETLSREIASEDLKVLDASWHLPTAERDALAEYGEAHIPGAVFFDVDGVSDAANPLPHMLPSEGAFGEAMGRLGVSNSDRVVVYDSVGVFSAPRVWWMLKAFGHDRAAVLDGGLPAWRAAGGAVEAGSVATPSATFEAKLRTDLVADAKAVLAQTQSGEGVVLDARPAARFQGEAPEPRPGLRSGHIPGSKNAPYTEFVSEGRMLTGAALDAQFEAAGLSLAGSDGRVTVSCGSGVSAAVLFLGLDLLGRRDVRLYDGSWADWGGRDDLPVATGPADH